MTTEPYEPLPWVSVQAEGGLTTFISIECKAATCRCTHRATLLYLPTVIQKPESIRTAVEEHRGCV